MALSAALGKTPDPAATLTKAFLRAAAALGVSQRELAQLLGVSAASVSRLFRDRTIAVASKEGELAILFVRLFRSLDALLGGDDIAAKRWYRAHNDHLGGIPAELVSSVTGFVHVIEYLDAMRGKL